MNISIAIMVIAPKPLSKNYTGIVSSMILGVRVINPPTARPNKVLPTIIITYELNKNIMHPIIPIISKIILGSLLPLFITLPDIIAPTIAPSSGAIMK